jgi:peroxiredoxin
MPIRPWLVCSLVSFAAACSIASEPTMRNKQPVLGSDFTLPDLKGKALSLQQLKGHIAVLNFWAFWCDTWKDELPHLKELAKEQTDRDFRLVAISVDGTRLQEFMDRTKGDVGFPVLLDAGSKVSASYKVVHVPSVIILDGAGRIRYTRSGYPGNEAIRTVLRRLQSERRKEAVARSPTPGD